MMKIIIDVYEPKQIREELIKLGCSIEVKDLRENGGDYHITDDNKTLAVLERKTIRDLILSTVQKEERRSHLFDQLTKIKRYERPIFIIEGTAPRWVSEWKCISYGKEYRLHCHFLIGIQIWCIKNNIFPIRAETLEETARLVTQLAKKLSQ